MIDCVRASSFHLVNEYYVEFRSADAYKLVIFWMESITVLIRACLPVRPCEMQGSKMFLMSFNDMWYLYSFDQSLLHLLFLHI